VSETKVQVRSNGPLRIEGEFEVVDSIGKPFGLAGRTVISLCRCGHSENKPFCDGSHGRVGFSSECPARDLPPPVAKPG
jgi:CDGSH-type Zn-finger protein